MIKDDNFSTYKRIVRNARNRMTQHCKGGADQQTTAFDDWDLLCAAFVRFEHETGRSLPVEKRKVIFDRCRFQQFQDENINALGEVGLENVSGSELVSFIDELCNRLAELSEFRGAKNAHVVGCHTIPTWVMKLGYALLKMRDGASLAEFSDGVGDFCVYAYGRNRSIQSVDIQLASNESQRGCAELRKTLGDIRAFVHGANLKVVSGDVFDSLPEAPFSNIFIVPPFVSLSERRDTMRNRPQNKECRDSMRNGERRAALLNDIRRMNRNLFLLKDTDRLTEEQCADRVDALMLLQVIRAKMLLREGGTLLALVPRFAVDRGWLAPLRRELVSRGWLKASVALPSGGFPGTGIDACLLVISEGNERVVLVDAKNEPTRDAQDLGLPDATVDKICKAIENDISEGEFSRTFTLQDLLDVDKNRDEKEIPLSLSAVFDRERLSEFKGLRLDEIASISRGSNISPKDRNGNPTMTKEESDFPVLDIKAMIGNGDWVDRASASRWKAKNYLTEGYARTVADTRLKFVEEGDILLPRLGTKNSFRPYLAQGIQSGKRWVIGQNLICIRPDNAKIISEFMHLYLENEAFSNQLKAICGNCSGVMMISPKGLGEVRIPDVNLESQQSKVCAINKLKRDLAEYKDKVVKCEEKLKHSLDEFRM